MTDRKRILASATLVMVGLAVAVTATGTVVSYRSAFVQKRSDLRAMARREAQIIDTTFRYSSSNEEHSPSDHAKPVALSNCPKCSAKIALIKHILREGGNLQSGWGEGVEFVVGSREGDSIRFLLPSLHAMRNGIQEPAAVPWASERAEPMRLALSGLSGTVEAKDYRGEVVLAAYAPVKWLGWGVVAKIDMAEMRAPFVTAVRDSLLLTVLVILVGLIVLWKRLNPLIQRSERSKEEALKALVELKNQKQAMDEHSIVAVTDPSGKITYANDKFCRISRYSREELIGRDHRIVNSGYHPRTFFAEMWKTIEAGRIWHGEICNRTKDGSLYWVDSTIVPFKDDRGRITQYVAIRTDITERKRAAAALIKAEAAEASNAAKSEFLTNMSHEIRTPMTAILGFAENMMDPNQSESEKFECIQTIRRNGEYLLGLINDILDLSKIEAGKMTIERRKCQPCRIIAEVASLMRVQADAKGLPFNIEYVGAIPETIQSDPTRLRQILINLIGNAIKFTETGCIRLVTRLVKDCPEPSLQFDVIDTGLGMTARQVAKLFQPFTQADTTTTRKFGGTGLGLIISKRFARLLGGDITVVGTDAGVGSTFRATVAIGSLDGVTMLEDPTSRTVVAGTASPTAQVSPSVLRGLHILLAEDGSDNQRLISFVLKKAGADTTVVENGKLAVEAALTASNEGSPFDVILMDMQMPVMDGYEATGQLRRKGYAGPIIALTAHAMDGDREKCIQAGCNEYEIKPIDWKKLVDTIRTSLEPAGAAVTCSTGSSL